MIHNCLPSLPYLALSFPPFILPPAPSSFFLSRRCAKWVCISRALQNLQFLLLGSLFPQIFASLPPFYCSKVTGCSMGFSCHLFGEFQLKPRTRAHPFLKRATTHHDTRSLSHGFTERCQTVPTPPPSSFLISMRWLGKRERGEGSVWGESWPSP